MPFNLRKPFDLANDESAKLRFWLVVFFALLLLCGKLLIISNFGNATPFWDQWDAEAENLYKPYLNGSLTWHHLINPHNEHRILTTRLLALGLLILNGGWNPLIQMMVNAAIHVIALTLLIVLLTESIGWKNIVYLLLFSLLIFSLPFGWENLLAGFQSQFGFVLLFGTISIWLISNSQNFKLTWWLGIFSAVLAFFSLASGVFVIAAVILVQIVQYALNVNRNRLQVLSIICLISLFLLEYFFTPAVIAHATLRAQNASQFFNSLEKVMLWPFSDKYSLLGILIHVPALVFVFGIIFKKDSSFSKNWFLLGLVFWYLGQNVSLAYGRANSPTTSRYLDLIILGLFVNFGALISICQEKRNALNFIFRFTFYSWICVLIFGVFLKLPILKSELQVKEHQNIEQEKNVRAYLCTNDASHLKGKDVYDLPYPNPDRLQMLLDDSVIRSILPGNILISKEKKERSNENIFCGKYVAF